MNSVFTSQRYKFFSIPCNTRYKNFENILQCSLARPGPASARPDPSRPGEPGEPDDPDDRVDPDDPDDRVEPDDRGPRPGIT